MHLKKIEKLKNGQQLFLFFANDKGRGRNNCIIQVVEKGERRNIVAKRTKNVLAEAYTTSWKGDVNFSKQVQKILGISSDDLVRIKEIKRIDDEIRSNEWDTMRINFDLIWMKIEKENKGEFGIVTKQQMKIFSEKMYSKGWMDRNSYDHEVKEWDSYKN
jgi:hypothetical protein